MSLDQRKGGGRELCLRLDGDGDGVTHSTPPTCCSTAVPRHGRLLQQ